MSKNVNIKQANKRYLEGDSWRCKLSPTGAHHWVCIWSEGKKSLWRCPHCGEERMLVRDGRGGRMKQSYSWHQTIQGLSKGR